MIARKLSKKSKKKRVRESETATTADCPAVDSEVASKPKKMLKIKKEEKPGSSRPRVEPQDPAFKKAKEDYSVAKDPGASEVLKSIFTTHKTAAEQTRAHWVTYNPFYN